MKKTLMFVIPFFFAVANGALASDANELAKRQYKIGQEHFQANRWAEAKAAFSSGYELSRRPGFLMNMAECERLLGHASEASTLYRRYLAEDPKGAQRGAAETRLKELEREASSAPPDSPSPSTGTAKGAISIQPSLPITPRVPATPPEEAPTLTTEERPVWISVALGGVGGLGVATGVALELAAFFTATGLEGESCVGGARTCDEEWVADTQRHNLFVGTGAAALGVGALGVGALVTYLVWPSEAVEASGQASSGVSAIAVVPWISVESAGAVVGGSF